MKKTLVTLSLDVNDIHIMSESSMENFIFEQPKRFHIIEWDLSFKKSDIRGTMHFFDRYLEMKISQAIFRENDYETAIYSCEIGGSWVLVANKKDQKETKK